MRRIALGMLAALALSSATAFAHHSFAKDYFEDRSVSIQGSVEEFLYRNPHAVLRVRVADPEKVAVVYAAEWAGAGRLSRLGIEADTLKPGDMVEITGAPGRVASEYRIHLRRIMRPSDGWAWGGGRERR